LKDVVNPADATKRVDVAYEVVSAPEVMV